MLVFEWDEEKAATNEHKHGVTFEQAKAVFWDENALLLEDESHSEDEARFYMLGLDASARELVVCHCYREAEEIIRIFSARRAEKWEQRIYWEERTR